MGKIALFAAGTFLFILLAASVSAYYSPGSMTLSDNIVYRETISGKDRGFSLQRHIEVPRVNRYGFYDWSYNPDIAYDQSQYAISEPVMFEAFRTFSADSQKNLDIKMAGRLGKYGGRLSYTSSSSNSFPSYYGSYGSNSKSSFSRYSGSF